MSTVAKSIIGFGALVATESAYGGGASLSTSTDGVQGAEPPTMDIEYSYSGERPSPPNTFGTLQFAQPTGETATGEIMVEGRGFGSAYSLSDTPPNLHALLLGAGFSGSLSGSTWRYDPTPAGSTPSSVAMEFYTRGEVYRVSGSYCDLSIETDGGAPPMFNFTFNGLPDEPEDASLPSITYSSVQPPKAENIGLTYGSVTDMIVRSFAINLNREITPRVDLNATSGSAGFATGRRAPELTMTVEALPLSTFDPYNEMKLKQTRPFEMTIGSEQYNRYTISGSAQVTAVAKGEDGPVATWDLTMNLVLEDGSESGDIFFIFD